ncbi:MAG TPA: ABC transporter ATP-binding protein [Bacilli bacterium]|nr:ABC transporter ATP-binding protein [Bacilli bacterium]
MNKALLKYFKPVRKSALLAIFLIILETALETMVPFMNAQIVDVGIANRDMPYIYLWGSLMILFSTLAFFVGIIGVKYVARTGQGFGSELRKAQFAKLQSMSVKSREKFATSSLISRLTNDTYTIQNAIIIGFRGLFRAPFMVVMVLALSFQMNAKLAIIYAFVLPIIGGLMLVIVFKVRPIFNYLQRAFDNLNLTLQENIQAIRVVKSYVTQEEEIKKFEKINNTYRKTAAKAFRTVSFNTPLMQLGLYSAIIALLFVGGDLISTGDAKVGQITGLLTYTLQLLNVLLMLAQLLIMLSRTFASGERIVELLESENEFSFVQESKDEVKAGVIEVNNVTFKYKESSAPILENISFKLNKQQTLGIIGQTGSGKSTLVHLLARLYDVTSGEVKLDGINIKELSKNDLLESVHVVFQSNMLFKGTIRENLKWGNEAASDAEIERALTASLALEIVTKLPDGLNSLVEQAGKNFSGGQKQRLMLARALITKPKVLILDDSLSAIDTINENKIKENLNKYYPELTLIKVSQRISALSDADEIIVLHEGKIHNKGTHDELLEKDIIYRDIYEMQLEGAKV